MRALVESLDPERSPIAALAAERAQKRARAAAEIRAGLSGLRARVADWLFREAARMLPERESGKAATMLCLDAARASVRRIGADLASRGERDAIDCHAMRDRSWGPRSDLTGMGVRLGYCYRTASAKTGFLLFTDITSDASNGKSGREVERDEMGRRYGYVIRG